MLFDALDVRGFNFLPKGTEYLLFIKVNNICEGCEERVLMNLSDLGFRVVDCGGRRGKATESGCGVRVFEKSSGICLKINDLEDKITETSNPSYSSQGEKNTRLLIPLFPFPLFSVASSGE